MHTTLLQPEYHLVGEIVIDYKRTETPSTKILTSLDSDEIFRGLFERINYKESCYILLVDVANNYLGWSKISEGGMSNTPVDFRLIFQCALKAHARGFVLAHNHPSLNPNPSQTDIKMTFNLQKACNIMDIRIIDHLILTEESYYSMSDEGLLVY